MLPAPAGDTLLVSRYCVVKLAVKVVAPAGVTVWEIAPPSLQPVQTF